MCLVTGRVTVVNAYATIRKETSFQAVCFHQKSKKPTTGQLKNSYLSMRVKLHNFVPAMAICYTKLKIGNIGKEMIVGDWNGNIV